MISIREVARLAGVSPATVSRVINGTANVNEDKRQRVLEVVRQTDFVPNEIARSLFKKSANIIGLIIPSIRNPYFTQMASVIDESVKKCGFRLFVCNVGDDLARVEELYGADYETNDTELTFTKGSTTLNLLMDGETVISIEYRMAV